MTKGIIEGSFGDMDNGDKSMTMETTAETVEHDIEYLEKLADRLFPDADDTGRIKIEKTIADWRKEFGLEEEEEVA